METEADDDGDELNGDDEVDDDDGEDGDKLEDDEPESQSFRQHHVKERGRRRSERMLKKMAGRFLFVLGSFLF